MAERSAPTEFSIAIRAPKRPVKAPAKAKRAATLAPKTSISGTTAVLEGAPESTQAVFIVHGMGQQVPFETLDHVYKGLVGTGRGMHAKALQVKADPEQRGSADKSFRRLNVTITSPEGRHHVHLYEGYWAPVTEGRVNLRDVLGFFTGAAKRGIAAVLARRGRWMFGESIDAVRGRRVRTFLGLALAGLVMAGLLAIASLGPIAVAAQRGARTEFSEAALDDLGAVAVLSAASVLLFAIPLGLSMLFKSIRRLMNIRAQRDASAGERLADVIPAPLGRPGWPLRALDGLTWIFFWVTCIILAAVAIFIPLLGVIAKLRGDAATQELPSLPNWMPYVAWAIVVAATTVARRFLVQYAGDVSAYVNSHKLDRFNDVRDEIKLKSRRVLDFVYDQPGETGWLYDHVHVVGHSLGSVVAYDTLNAIINDDINANNKRDVIARTKLLLTFGSPLDKTAFIFESHSRKASKVRPAMAALVQPLIQSYEYRRMDWVNVYSKRDIISGPLDIYDHDCRKEDCKRDDPVRPEEAQLVHNIADDAATTPVVAHVEYWRNATVWNELWKRIHAAN